VAETSERPTERSDLDARSREVLREVVLNYVRNGEPVSSRLLSKSRSFELSPATLRNVMADLEDSGFLVQPHTSAGRIPTDLGYRFFVDVLMHRRQITPEERQLVQANLETVVPDQSAFFGAVSRVLSSLSEQVAVVLAPTPSTAIVRSLHFVRVGEKRFLAVLVSDQGLVDHRLVVHDEDYGQPELDRLSNLLSEEFAGVNLFQMRERVVRAMAETHRQYEEVLARMLPLADRTLDQEAEATTSSIFVEGTAHMLDKPEFADIEQMRRLFEAFEDKARLVGLLAGCIDSKKSRIVIGSESPFTGDMDLSVVVTRYGAAGHGRGSIGIVGPRRMDYSRLLPLVEFLGTYLGNRMSDATTGD